MHSIRPNFGPLSVTMAVGVPRPRLPTGYCAKAGSGSDKTVSVSTEKLVHKSTERTA